MANKIEAQIEKIEKAKETIAKKQNTIVKKRAQIDKKKALLEKTCDEQERYWIQCDIDELVYDLGRLEKEIEQKKEVLANHKARLVVLQEQEAKINAIFDEAASECEKEDVASIIRDAVSHIHAERYGMTVREHEELDKVLKAMRGYLEYTEKKQEVMEE